MVITVAIAYAINISMCLASSVQNSSSSAGSVRGMENKVITVYTNLGLLMRAGEIDFIDNVRVETGILG